jgi:hypothetical protein
MFIDLRVDQITAMTILANFLRTRSILPMEIPFLLAENARREYFHFFFNSFIYPYYYRHDDWEENPSQKRQKTADMSTDGVHSEYVLKKYRGLV